MKALLLGMVLAQTSPGTKAPPKYAPVTKITIDDEGPIVGVGETPWGTGVDVAHRPVCRSILKIRENFNRQVLDSAKELP
jgi:hypothetical protein